MIQVLGNRILLEKWTPDEHTTANGYKSTILIPESAREWVLRGFVKGIGEMVDIVKYGVKIDDFVLYASALVGIDIELDGKKYKICNPDNILAVREEDPMSVNPLPNKIVCEMIKEESVCGIIKPGKSAEESNKANVLSVGSFVENVKADDVILVGNTKGQRLTIDGKDILIIDQSDVVAKF